MALSSGPQAYCRAAQGWPGRSSLQTQVFKGAGERAETTGDATGRGRRGRCWAAGKQPLTPAPHGQLLIAPGSLVPLPRALPTLPWGLDPEMLWTRKVSPALEHLLTPLA